MSNHFGLVRRGGFAFLKQNLDRQGVREEFQDRFFDSVWKEGLII